MSNIEEQLTDQFYDWERYGRGWYTWEMPVLPEPPFQPFFSHSLPPQSIPDDGRKPTFLSSLIRKWGGGDISIEPAPIQEQRPEPNPFERSEVVELQTSLPSSSQISREATEQLLLALGYCDEPLSFELIGSADSILAQFAGSIRDMDRLEEQLAAFCIDGVFTKTSGALERKWEEGQSAESLVVEFGLSREFMFPIASARSFNLDPLIGIVGALSRLQDEEIGVIQVLFDRVRNPWSESVIRSVSDGSGRDFFVNVPELSKAAKEKTSRPLFAVVVRIAVKADEYERIIEIARGLTGSLSVYENPNGNEFIPLLNDSYPSADHEEDLIRRQSRRSGMILNSEELTSLAHLPSSSVRTPKLKREAQKSKVAPRIVLDTDGIILGTNYHAGVGRTVYLNPEQRVRHAHVIGASGTGKSTLLFNLIRQDIESGQGVAVLDPHGDLIDQLCGCIPEARIPDTILLDPSDEEFSIGFNILSAHSDLEKTLLSSDLVSVFQRLSTSWGDQMGSVLNNAILAFLESSKGGTLADLRRFLIEPGFRNGFLETVDDPDIVYYWKKGFPLLTGGKSIGSILTRLDTFLGPKPIRYMVSQKENRLNFADIMNGSKILLVKLSQGKMGKENSYLMGSLLVAKLHQAAMSRASLAESARRNYWIYIDEFHNFITPSMSEILSGARKYRIGLILAHQELHQLQRDSDVASAVLSQPYSRICFRVGDDDARRLGDGFSFFDSRDLQRLPNYEAICRVERADFDFNLHSVPPPPRSEAELSTTRAQVIAFSREKYAVPRQKIEADLARLRREDEPRRGKGEPESKPPTPTSGSTSSSAQPSDHIEPINLPKTDYEKPGQATETTRKECNTSPAPTAEAPRASSPQASDPVETPPIPITTELENCVEPIIPKIPSGDQSEPKADENQTSKASRGTKDNGIGGNQHNLIRKRIEQIAEGLGYTAAREDTTCKTRKIDLVLTKPGRSIACEIAVTTTIDHEVGNVAKCIEGGFKIVAVIATTSARLDKIKAGVSASLSAEAASRVGYFKPEAFIGYLEQLETQDLSSEPKIPGETTVGKYKVRRKVAGLSAEEIKAREATTIAILTETLKKKKRKTKLNET